MPYRKRFHIVLFLSALLASRFAHAQDPAAVAALHTPEQSIASLTLWPASTSQKHRFRLAPWEVATAAGLEFVGLDPLMIQRVDLISAMPGPLGPQLGVLIQTLEPIDLAQLNPQLFAGAMQQEDGFQFVDLASPDELLMIAHQVDQTTLIVGNKGFVKLMVANRAGHSEIANMLASIKSPHDGLLMLSVEDLRPLILSGVEQGRDQLPPEIADDLETVIQTLDFLALRLTSGDVDKMQLVAMAKDSEAAEKLEQSLLHVIEFGTTMFVADMNKSIDEQADTLPQISNALRSYTDRLSDYIAGQLTPARAGNRLILNFEGVGNVGTIGVLAGLLLPAVQQAREAAQRMSASNQLRQCGLALLNYEFAYKEFPPTAILDKKTQTPLLSWRVAILPFIEEAELYQRFHLDEPWDSAHNIELLKEMPEVFKDPRMPLQPFHTVYQAVVSEHSLLRADEPTKLATVTDGLSNTIMLVETSAEAAVPWTQPTDYTFDPAEPSNMLNGEGTYNGFNVLMGDGSVQLMSPNIDNDMLNAFFTRDGNESINY